MVLVMSTFKVANGMEELVRQAFLDRPHLVDHAPGFLGMEVLVDREDASVFQLLTRWTDQASFQRWHSGPIHKLAHCGMPKGLKLDPAHTSLCTLDVFASEPQADPVPPAQALVTTVPRFLDRTCSVHWLSASLDGRIIAANPAFESLFQVAPGQLAGQSLWYRMTQPDAATLMALLDSGTQATESPLLLNFVSRDQSVRTLSCHVDVLGGSFVLVAELVPSDDRALAAELFEMNNQFALLAREHEKNLKALQQSNAELERALEELKQSHWHLRKIQETLPICMYCGRVKTGTAHWEDVVEYLKQNSLFLSHGCCPDCLPRMERGDGAC